MKRNMEKVIASSCILIALNSWIAPVSAVSAAKIPGSLVIPITPETFNMDVVRTDVPLKQGRMTVNTFYGGVTGILGFGTVWGEFYPTQRRVTVYAYGKERNTRMGDPRTTVRVTALRAFSENTSGWWWA